MDDRSRGDAACRAVEVLAASLAPNRFAISSVLNRQLLLHRLVR
jgi:hypothetical protein